MEERVDYEWLLGASEAYQRYMAKVRKFPVLKVWRRPVKEMSPLGVLGDRDTKARIAERSIQMATKQATQPTFGVRSTKQGEKELHEVVVNATGRVVAPFGARKGLAEAYANRLNKAQKPADYTPPAKAEPKAAEQPAPAKQ